MEAAVGMQWLSDDLMVQCHAGLEMDRLYWHEAVIINCSEIVTKIMMIVAP